ncbi:MAG TPA: hypothetical protein VIV60_15760 [Polyangiaceae bacterium]
MAMEWTIFRMLFFLFRRRTLAPLREKLQHFVTSAAPNDDLGFRYSNNATVGERGTHCILLAIDEGDLAVGRNQHRFKAGPGCCGRPAYGI